MIQPAENNNANDLILQIDRLLDDLTELASATSQSIRPRQDFYSKVLGLVGAVVDAPAGAVLNVVRRSVEPIETVGVIDRICDVIQSLQEDDATWFVSFFERKASVVMDNESIGSEATVLLHPVDAQQQMILAFWWPEKLSDSSRILFQGLFEAVAEVLSDFENNLAIESVLEKQKFFGKLHQFATALSESVDLNETAITVANFGRSLFQAQRVAVLECRRRRNRVLAVSNAATVNHRADEILAIETVANEIETEFAGKFFFSMDGSNPSELAKPYLEKTTSGSPEASRKCISIMRLEMPDGNEVARSKGVDLPMDGSFLLFIEHDTGALDKSHFFETVRFIEPQVANSLHNAREVTNIPFRKVLIRMRDFARNSLGSWTRFLSFAILLFAFAALFICQRRIVVYADGELVPEATRFVFAPEEGRLVRLLVVDGQAVSKGESLAEFESKSLELIIQTEVDEIDAQTKLLKSLELAFAATEVNESANSQIDSISLSGEIKSVEKRIEHHQRRLSQLLDRKKSLSIRSPIDGIVIAWNASEQLNGRPMKKGDPIIKVVKESSEWFADVHVDNMDVEHLMVNGKLSPAIESSVVVATKPGISYSATVESVAESVDFDPSENRNTVTFRLLIERNESPDLKTGASVNAKFRGHKSTLFYSWFYRGIRQLQYQYF